MIDESAEFERLRPGQVVPQGVVQWSTKRQCQTLADVEHALLFGGLRTDLDGGLVGVRTQDLAHHVGRVHVAANAAQLLESVIKYRCRLAKHAVERPPALEQ